jgi:ferritin-like metal-binding protein YciE
MKTNSLKELYLEELKDAYDAEMQIVKALPKLVRAASSPDLRNALEEHLEQTKGHVQRLEEIFNDLGEQPKAKKCDGLRGILQEGEKVVKQERNSAVRDAGIIAGVQRVEHYEMAVYGSLKTWAWQLGNRRGAELFEETLGEEKMADNKLTDIATGAVNAEVAQSAQAEV